MGRTASHLRMGLRILRWTKDYLQRKYRVQRTAIDVPVRALTWSKARASGSARSFVVIPAARATSIAAALLSTCMPLPVFFPCISANHHRWEHDPAWAVTSKLLISKHQQVQLLEAASVLVNMNMDGSSPPPEVLHVQDSEGSSASPGFSGSSELQDELSSAETTPPPMSDAVYPVPEQKRYSSSSAGFSRSYRSIPSSSYAESVISPGLPPHRFSASEMRPTTSGTDDGGLAAAAELLNFGTPRTRPTPLSADVPPVPPLPERYQASGRLAGNSSTPTIYNPLSMHPPTLTQPLSDERGVKVDGKIEDGSGHNDHAQTDDDEYGMFRMEE